MPGRYVAERRSAGERPEGPPPAGRSLLGGVSEDDAGCVLDALVDELGDDGRAPSPRRTAAVRRR